MPPAIQLLCWRRPQKITPCKEIGMHLAGLRLRNGHHLAKIAKLRVFSLSADPVQHGSEGLCSAFPPLCCGRSSRGGGIIGTLGILIFIIADS